MENTEIMNNEVINVAEEIVTADSGKVLKTLGIVGGIVVVGAVAYKYVVKPIVKKVKDKKELADGVTEDDVEPVESEIVVPDKN